MSVWVRQVDDDVVMGEYLIAPVDDMDSDLDLLNRKADSHNTRGWTLVWLVPQVRFSVTKAYPTNGAIQRERIFEIR